MLMKMNWVPMSLQVWTFGRRPRAPTPAITRIESTHCAIPTEPLCNRKNDRCGQLRAVAVDDNDSRYETTPPCTSISTSKGFSCRLSSFAGRSSQAVEHFSDFFLHFPRPDVCFAETDGWAHQPLCIITIFLAFGLPLVCLSESLESVRDDGKERDERGGRWGLSLFFICARLNRRG